MAKKIDVFLKAWDFRHIDASYVAEGVRAKERCERRRERGEKAREREREK